MLLAQHNQPPTYACSRRV